MPTTDGTPRTTRPAWRCRAGRAWAAAGDGLRMYRGTTLLLAITATLALASVLPVAGLLAPDVGRLAPRLGLTAGRGGDLGLPWVTAWQGPAEIASGGLTFFFNLLLTSAAATLAIAGISLLTLCGARALAREGEVSVRRAVGASRRSLIAAAVLEGLLIGGVAAFFGGALGLTGATIAARSWPGPLHPGSATAGLVAVAGVTMIVLTGALLPVIFARRNRIGEAETAAFALFWPALLQLGLSLIVLATGALLARHASRSHHPAAGQTDPLLQLEMPATSAGERATRYGRLLTDLAGRPELGLASLTSPGAIVGLGTVARITTDCGLCYDGGLPIKWHTPRVVHQFVSADSFKALGIPLLAGRGITPADRLGAEKVAVVSRSLARDHFQFGEPIGRTLKAGDDADDWYTVVGVVDDVVPTGFGAGRQPGYTLYLSILQHPVTSADLLLRRPSGPVAPSGAPTLASAVAQTRATVLAITSDAALFAAEQAPLDWFGRGLRWQGWSMLAIAAIGLLAVIRIWVRSAWPEFGMRRAVGARKGQITGIVVRQAIAVAIGGLGLGLWFGPALWSSLPDLVTGLSPWDAGALLPYASALITVTLLGAIEPAWAAARATPHALLGSTGA